MRIGKNTLNNMMLSNLRKNQVYQAVITDLAITGSIKRDTAETLLGYSIPSFLKTPDGKHFEDEEHVAKVENKKEKVVDKTDKVDEKSDDDEE